MSHNSTTSGDVNILEEGLGMGAFILVMLLLLGYLGRHLLGTARRDCTPCLCVRGDDGSRQRLFDSNSNPAS